MSEIIEKRPLSQYDNLTGATSNTTTTTTANSNANAPQFSDLSFKFDDVDGSGRSYQYKKPVMSDAKSIFFGLQNKNEPAGGEETAPLVSRSNNKSPVQIHTPLKANGKGVTPSTPSPPSPPLNDASSSKSAQSSNGSGKKITLLVDESSPNVDGDSAKRLSQGFNTTPSQVRIFRL